MFFSNQPYYILHSLMYALFAGGYVLFSLLFFAAEGTDCDGNGYVYAVLDWNKPAAASVYALATFFVGIPLFSSLLFVWVGVCFPGKFRTGPPPLASAAAGAAAAAAPPPPAPASSSESSNPLHPSPVPQTAL
jgi:hypothetical protein